MLLLVVCVVGGGDVCMQMFEDMYLKNERGIDYSLISQKLAF